MHWGSWFLAAGLAVCPGAPVCAQQITVAKVVFSDPGSFAQADLESVAGVHPGQKLMLKDIQSAAQRLADTGCFEDVRADSNGSPSALTLIFRLKPSLSGDVHEAVFENFVWFTPAEVQAVVHASAPLFGGGGKLPETPGVLEAVSAGLVTASVAKGIGSAEVAHEVELATSAHPESVVRFRANRPAVLVGAVTLNGAGPELAGSRAIAARLHGAPYIAGIAAGSTAEVLLRPYLDAGYIDAHLSGEKISFAPTGAEHITVDMAASVESGAVYRVTALSFTGTPVMSADAFAAAATLHPGNPASHKQLLESQEVVDAAYHKLGYMDAYVEAVPTKNATSHTVSYSLRVFPGEVYRVGKTNVEGLPPAAKAQFDVAWKLRPGELYNADYVRSFLKDNTAILALGNYAGSFQASADPSTHLVDLTVQFQPAASTSSR